MSRSTTKTIAVAGATGAQGGAVVDALLDRGARVRALVRSPGPNALSTWRAAAWN